MEKINAVMVFEIMGKPKEHIVETLNMVLDKIGKEEGVRIANRRVHEAKEIEKSDLFTSFAEIETEVAGLQKLMVLFLTYMPAHVEILSPGEIKMKNFDFNLFCNDLITKLHNYDSIAKTVLFKNSILEKQLTEALQQGKIKVEVSKIKKTSKKARVKKRR